jgi:type IV secretory pathway TraG/TraD family ATPase VirD4
MNEKIRLGYWDRTCTETLVYPGDAHGFICAPAGEGKGRDLLIPMLLSCRKSCLVLDVKGQAAAVTARFRKDVLGQEVFLLNPFNILPEYLGRFDHAQYDVTASLDPHSPTFTADAGNVIEASMVPDPHGADYWFNGGSDIATGVLLQSKTWCPKTRIWPPSTTRYAAVSCLSSRVMPCRADRIIPPARITS